MAALAYIILLAAALAPPPPAPPRADDAPPPPAVAVLTDPSQALASAKERSLPLFVLNDSAFGEPAAASAALAGLVASKPFAAASAHCILLRLLYAGQLNDAFETDDGEAPLAFISLPTGAVYLSYRQLPSPEAIAKDLASASAHVLIALAADFSSSGDDTSAIASLKKALALSPPYAQLSQAASALAAISARGRRLTADASERIRSADYAGAKAALENVISTYSGTDAELLARDRLKALLADPSVTRVLPAQEAEAKARAAFDSARRTDEDRGPDAASPLYEKITREFKGTTAASQAADRLHEIRTASPDAAASQQQTDRDCKTWMAFADNFHKNSMDAKAREYYRKIIDTYPDSDYAVRAREKLDKLPPPSGADRRD